MKNYLVISVDCNNVCQVEYHCNTKKQAVKKIDGNDMMIFTVRQFKFWKTQHKEVIFLNC